MCTEIAHHSEGGILPPWWSAGTHGWLEQPLPECELASVTVSCKATGRRVKVEALRRSLALEIRAPLSA
ncbi:hypothetical protein [Erwinia pyrifoliae]|uniref:Uncharacterized protein n=1 Tax=Erwinia pyrifoliae TaxID=79967 RepID=A0ABY5XBS2_ERWPY|nr:hypothetical protein [Erwinia pyrifoliae]AUX72992.1 hypothetical protein CPI84_11165 [Erwinia pyrifoliae]MCA8876731.1 hypothetical protein [Erwinia pyrifoliae]MCT2386890.1 hypothetical protein [Erwinia pyrifoliae]MCU8587511.1 hypothetical protein [Erwinia pyrifoliae]UWS31353.1 hypothetical protein NYP81_07905 [Erwinia pyrifoliae]